MHDWIALDGIKSTALEGVVVMDYTPLYLPVRNREETSLPGRLSAITQKAWQQDPADLTITLAVVGADQQEVHRRWRETVAPWLYHASRLVLDDAPEHFHRGAVTQVQQVEDEDRWIRLQVTFRCNPPCRLRMLTSQAGWYPAEDVPIPRQLTAQNATVSKSLTEPGWLETSCGGLEDAECYIAVTGTWKTLRLGDGFQVAAEAAGEITLYLDGENEQVWRCEEDSTEVNMMSATTGDLPRISASNPRLYVGGEDIDVTVHLLVIERG